MRRRVVFWVTYRILLLVLSHQLLKRFPGHPQTLSGLLRERRRGNTRHEPEGGLQVIVQFGLKELQGLVTALAFEPSREL